ncbi:hypothetical protein F4777DRAFT_562315 [Nemania sp. FL0916]|nr:hypothetical protein F4777DRAFT_562315 [Nemania sp. FL0916]
MLARLRSFFSQYYPPNPAFTEAQLVPGSQNGRVFIVTGGNHGIGFELCKMLINTGATIYMASRSKEKAEAAIKKISDAIPPNAEGMGQIKFLHLDLADLTIVQDAARNFAQQESRLDILWNNAGTGGFAVTFGDRTAQDFEPLMGMHCIATLLFTELLRPLLQAAASLSTTPASTRVLWLTSNLADTHGPVNGVDFSLVDTGCDDPAENYALSKAGVWMLAREFDRRYGKDGIVSLTVNPGNVKAGSYAGAPRILMVFLNAVSLHDTILGAYTELYAGLSPDIKQQDDAKYVLPWGRLSTNDRAWRQDIVKAIRPENEGGLGYGEKLWGWCEDQWKPHLKSSS